MSQKGQVLIPKELREKLGIETPGEVFVYEGQGHIIIEPVPSPSELHGIHTGENERGEILERMRELKNKQKLQEEERVDRLYPSEDT